VSAEGIRSLRELLDRLKSRLEPEHAR
jgi:hypothetical protein